MVWSILIIEPYRAYSNYIIKKTEELDITIHVVQSLEEAIVYLNEKWINVVLFSDEDLDEKLIETIQELKSTKSSPAIFITGEGVARNVEKAMQSGASAYLTYEYFLRDFKKQLNKIWSNKAVDSETHDRMKELRMKLTTDIPKIMVVDDSPILRRITKKMLPEGDYEVLTANDGMDCLNKLSEFHPDIILTDIVMPGINGIELCEKIKKSPKYRDIPVLLMSTETEIGRKINGFNIGAADYLTKPFEAEELRARIATHFLQKKLIEDLKLENLKRTKAEENLREYTNKLEDIVAERTRTIQASNVLLKNEINDRKKIQSDLEKNQKKFKDMVETINEWIWEVTDAGVLIYNSPKVFDLLGYTSEEILGSVVYKLMTEEEAIRIKPFFETNELKPLPIKSFEHSCQHKNGMLVTIESSWVPFFDKNNILKGYRGVSRDTSDLKKSKDEKNTLEHQLLQAEKMASIGQLAAGVAHEINNPIGFVKSNLYTLSDYISDINKLMVEYQALFGNLNSSNLTNTELEQIASLKNHAEELDIDYIVKDSEDLINDCKEGIGRITNIISSLKDFAHPGEEKNSFADINSNIDSTLVIVWNELKYKTTIIKKYGELPEVYCNIQQLNQVFMNLLVNAAHAIESKGVITITTKCVDEAHVEVRIDDTGKGIPADIQTRIFEPFFTTKEVGLGTGLGLNISYNIIAKHGGTIEVESESGKGASFIITLAVNPSKDKNAGE